MLVPLVGAGLVFVTLVGASLVLVTLVGAKPQEVKLIVKNHFSMNYLQIPVDSEGDGG